MRKLEIKYPVIKLLILILIPVAISCQKDDDDKMTEKEHNIELETSQEIPTVINRNEKGTANLKLYEDSTLSFKISVSDLSADDQLTVAQIHTGGPVDVGSPVIVLVDNSAIKFNGNSASGTVKLNSSQFNAVKNDGDFYVNVHSTKLPLGLVRGQLNKTITYAQNIDLTAMSNPLRPETGTAILRMDKDSTLFYKVSVNNLTEGDMLTSAQINVGASGVEGPSIISLYSSFDEYGTAKSTDLTGSQANFLLTSPVYISVSSEQVPGELLRGQIR
ncbi:MAG: CHRD domain-containing protein [Bacteroidales bacterium]|nr:CHRD domain-containing protein [Bacteroidales bacterium]